MGARVLYESKHARLELDEWRRLVRYTRTAEPFASLDEAEQTFATIGGVDLGHPRSELVMLSDVRAALGRNDEAYEAVITRYREMLVGGFAKRAVLVRTVAGQLQVQRLNRGATSSVRVFTDEHEALAFLAH